MAWTICGTVTCGTRIRTGRRGFNGFCGKCRRRQAAPSRTRGPIGCMYCTKPRFSVICARCAGAYDRWQRSPENTGDHWSLMRWVAKRVRRFAKITPPA